MSYKVVTIPRFDKDVKRLAKKYRSIKLDITELARQLSENPLDGDEIFKNCYKIRMAISSKGKGKSGRARVISYVLVQDTTVFLLTIYDKSEKESIDNSEILKLIRGIGF